MSGAPELTESLPRFYATSALYRCNVIRRVLSVDEKILGTIVSSRTGIVRLPPNHPDALEFDRFWAETPGRSCVDQNTPESAPATA